MVDKREIQNRRQALILVRDIPEYETIYDEKKDPFNHNTYANIIAQIVRDNQAPLAIGLMGPWGSGKSTILNILINQLKESEDFKTVYFNAWKYADDSFRRQFILECIDNLVAKEKKEGKRNDFKLRFIRDVKREMDSWQQILTRIKIKPNIPTLISVLISFLIMIPFLVWGLSTRNVPLSISSFLMGLVMYIIQKQIPDLFQVNMPVDVDPRLVLPEQFEDEFRELVKGSDTNKIIFIIDDIDRCPPHMIMDVLDSIKNFLAPCGKLGEQDTYKKCYFIVAMDDEAIISILTMQRGSEYENEEVLKFFDAVVRLNPLRIGDLVEFSKYIARQTNVAEDIVDVAIYGGFDTPRKIKHFLNCYKVAYTTAAQRFRNGIFPFDPKDVSSRIAKILVMQIVFRNEFEELLYNVSLLERWEEEACTLFQTASHPSEIQKSQPEKRFPSEKFLRFLWITRDVKIEDIDPYLHFKMPVWATHLPRYSTIRDAIIRGIDADTEQYLRGITSKDQKETIVETFREVLDFEISGLFLSKILSSGIEIYKIIEFPDEQKKRLSNILLRHLIRHGKVLSFEPNTVFDIAQNVAQRDKREKELVELCLLDLQEGSNPLHVSQFINILYLRKFIL